MDERAFDAFYAGSVGRLIGQLYAVIGDRTEAQVTKLQSVYRP
ncbi:MULTISPECIES: hypothetical protein [Streptomyces]